MKKVIVAKNFSLRGKIYKKDDEILITDVKDLVKLNENGFIKPLTIKEIHKIVKLNGNKEDECNE